MIQQISLIGETQERSSEKLVVARESWRRDGRATRQENFGKIPSRQYKFALFISLLYRSQLVILTA